MPNTQIVVKFSEWYNTDTHHLLAAEGLALKLHYSSTDDNVRLWQTLHDSNGLC